MEECEAEVKKPKSRKPRAQSMNHKLHRHPKQDEGYNDSTPEHQPSVILSASFSVNFYSVYNTETKKLDLNSDLDSEEIGMLEVVTVKK